MSNLSKQYNIPVIKKMTVTEFIKLNPIYTRELYYKVTGKKPPKQSNRKKGGK